MTVGEKEEKKKCKKKEDDDAHILSLVFFSVSQYE